MKKLIGIIFITTCFFNTNLHARSNESLLNKVKSHFSVQYVKKHETTSFNLKKKVFKESFQATFPEEPSEFYHNFNEELYQSIISNDDEETVLYLEETAKVLFPKESYFYLILDDNLSYSHFLGTSRLQKDQDQVAESVNTLMADWKKSYERINEEWNAEWGEEHHLEYTPLVKDENGNYTTEVFYSYVDRALFEGDEDDEEFIWGKVVISPKNIYYLFYFSTENNSLEDNKASTFLSSFRIKH